MCQIGAGKRVPTTPSPFRIVLLNMGCSLSFRHAAMGTILRRARLPSVTANVTNERIQRFSWLFGDGTMQTSEKNPSAHFGE